MVLLSENFTSSAALSLSLAKICTYPRGPMKQSGGKLQVLPNDVYMIDEKLLAALTESGISYEVIEQK